MKLIVGLGNPGNDYTATRHNAGFMALDILADKFGASFSYNKKFLAETAEFKIGKNKLVLAKPQTFMNESGKSARIIADFYKIKPQDLVVVHDDKDICLGSYKIQSGRSSAGHNGVQSIIDHMGSKDFLRLRLGIMPEKNISDTADFVLGKFTKKEKNILDKIIHEAIEKIVKEL